MRVCLFICAIILNVFLVGGCASKADTESPVSNPTTQQVEVTASSDASKVQRDADIVVDDMGVESPAEDSTELDQEEMQVEVLETE